MLRRATMMGALDRLVDGMPVDRESDAVSVLPDLHRASVSDVRRVPFVHRPSSTRWRPSDAYK